MKYGRVETYVHSDEVTENKGACIVSVRCQSEAAARTAEFKKFCEKAAMRHYAAAVVGVPVDEVFPEMAEDKADLEKALKEQIVITGVTVMQLQHDGFHYGTCKAGETEGFAVMHSDEELEEIFRQF